MKKLIVLMLCLLITGIAFAGGAQESESYTFAATYMTMNNPFFGVVQEGLEDVINAKGDKVIAFDPHFDLAKQIAQIEDMIAQGVDAIFLNPVDWKGVKSALEAANDAGIPIINIDTPVFDDHLVKAIIASDNYNAGVLCAKDMMSKVDSAKIVILEHPVAKSAIDRTQAFIDTIGDNPEYEIVARQSSDGRLEMALPIMENIIQAQPDINVVMNLNDQTALGAIAALETADRFSDVLIYGVDGAPSAKKSIKEGKMTATASQSPMGLGRTAAEVAYKILAGESVDHIITVPVTLIDKNNVDDFGLDGWQ